MPTSRKRTVAVQTSALNSTTELLKNLPEKSKSGYTLKEAVATLSTEIQTALDKGYNYEEIAEFLAEDEIAIAPTSLRYYLAEQNRQSRPGSTSEKATQAKASRQATRKKAATDWLARELKMSLDPDENVDEVISFLIDDEKAPASRKGKAIAPTSPEKTPKRRGRPPGKAAKSAR